jgi:hypothetical protein
MKLSLPVCESQSAVQLRVTTEQHVLQSGVQKIQQFNNQQKVLGREKHHTVGFAGNWVRMVRVTDQ